MGGIDGGEHTVKVASLNSNYEPINNNYTDITINGFKNTYSYKLNNKAVGLKILGINNTILSIYEIDDEQSPVGGNPPGPADPGSQVLTNNIDHAYDRNYNTSANILSALGYIEYAISDLGLVGQRSIQFVMSSLNEGEHSVSVSALNESMVEISNSTIVIKGYKGTYLYNLPDQTSYIKINGILNDMLCIYEIEPAGTIFSSYSNNLDHAYDGSFNTSANIFHQNGYIDYSLGELNLFENTTVYLVMGTIDGESYNVSVQSIDSDLNILDPGSIISIAGYKNAYQYTIPVGAVRLKISGVPDSVLCIYEIGLTAEPVNVDPPTPFNYYNSNNLDHAYDGNMNTSANIFSSNGFIIYDLTTLGLDVGDTVEFIMNTANSDDNSVSIEFLNGELDKESDGTIVISGHKGSYSYLIPEDTAYIKIYGVLDDALYIFEITKAD